MGVCVSCGRSATNFVIIKQKPRSSRFSMRTFPSFTGRWTLYHRPVVTLPDGSGKAITEHWTTGRWRSVNGRMYIYGRKEVYLGTAYTKSTKRCSGRAWATWHSVEPTKEWRKFRFKNEEILHAKTFSVQRRNNFAPVRLFVSARGKHPFRWNLLSVERGRE